MGEKTVPNPEISVVTATWNALPGLRKTIESVAAQTYAGVEHVIVDGASDDGTPEFLAGLGTGVRWISEPDKGIADAMNKGIARALGAWIIVLHAEDTFLNPASLERAARHLRTDADMVSFDVKVTRADGSWHRYRSHGLSVRTNFKTTIPHQGVFCRVDAAKRIGAFDPTLKIAMDYDYFLRAHRLGLRADVVREMLTEMPATGISAQTDWRSLATRFAEEREIHRRQAGGLVQRAIYAVYWPAYLAYRRGRAFLAKAG